ncbi:hypothetical protein SCHPADRAFT_598644 [Schizopora paradoxa]|uniref:Uncharacterized protein n=1 Tax=Schizopora paradoxa TaxID=27342 RepID=A0A0H2RBD3_9AGAM|nr:hypothetical protein SCHPADRAFT_598644 [Schizopora paradoxa]
MRLILSDKIKIRLDDVAVAINTPFRLNPKICREYLNARSFSLSRMGVDRRSGAAKINRRRRGNETVDARRSSRFRVHSNASCCSTSLFGIRFRRRTRASWCQQTF